jgi:hypothetical protein
MRDRRDGKISEQSDQALLAYARKKNDGTRLVALGSLIRGSDADAPPMLLEGLFDRLGYICFGLCWIVDIEEMVFFPQRLVWRLSSTVDWVWLLCLPDILWGSSSFLHCPL